jgi:hypothetical protein
VRDCAVHTTAKPSEVLESFGAAFFTVPSWDALGSWRNIRNARWQLLIAWQEAQFEDADAAVELVGKGWSQASAARAGLLVQREPGPCIALRIEVNPTYQLAYMWRPPIISNWFTVGAGFRAIFRNYTRIVYENIRDNDATAELMRNA